MAHLQPKEVPGYIEKVSKEAAMMLQGYLTTYFDQGVSRERVVQNMDRHVKQAIRALDEVLGFLGEDDLYL
jgi:hypothetical protein